MRTYWTTANTAGGRRKVSCKTSAKTRAGVLKAMGKAIARELRTDVFELPTSLMYREGVARGYDLGDIRQMRITKGDEHEVWKAAQDELFEMMY